MDNGGIMEVINSWVNCILATVILIGLVETILPEGETRRFVLLITGVITSIVIATPIFKLFSSDFSYKDVFNVEIEENFYYIDTLRNTIDRQGEILEEVFADNVIRHFNNTYFDMELSECRISFLRDTSGKIIEVSEVIVKAKNKVDDITLLKKRVATICEVSEKKVRLG